MVSGVAHERLAGPDGPPEATLLVLHGFLGSGRNWRTWAGGLVEWRPDWAVELVDLRLHGESRDVAGPHGLQAAAADLERVARPPFALLGHSLGGKVALTAAVRTFDAPPLQTWVIDSTPFPTRGDGSAARMLQVIDDSPESFADRRAAVEFVENAGFDPATARWMATNLRDTSDGLRWELDHAGLTELYEDFLRLDLADDLTSLAPDHDVHFVRATRNSALDTEGVERLETIAALGAPLRLHEIEGGHWLHIDNPRALLELVAGALPRP